MLLCVDGIDPDLVQEYGWDVIFKNNYSLKIPQECYVPDPELGSTPHTTRVWATIFSGKKIDYGLIKREGARKMFHDLLVRARITWKAKPSFKLYPSNLDLETLFDNYESFTWNLPTMNPEWISTFPSYEAFVEYCHRERKMWCLMVKGSDFLEGELEIEAYYLRYIDFVGHNDWKNLRKAYNGLFTLVAELKKFRSDVILLSDHGCKDGVHTERAYLGSDHSFNAEWVHELRADFERILDGPLDGE
jgi:hypothetical protein